MVIPDGGSLAAGGALSPSGMLRLRRAALLQALTSVSHCHSRGLNRKDTKIAEIGK